MILLVVILSRGFLVRVALKGSIEMGSDWVMFSSKYYTVGINFRGE